MEGVNKPVDVGENIVPFLQPKDIAEAIVYVLSTRPGVQVSILHTYQICQKRIR